MNQVISKYLDPKVRYIDTVVNGFHRPLDSAMHPAPRLLHKPALMHDSVGHA